jgi:hypothetical protein
MLSFFIIIIFFYEVVINLFLDVYLLVVVL